MSMHRTRLPFSANATARFRVVVVLATPPFWLAKAMTFIGMLSPSSRKAPSWSVRDPSRAVFAARRPIPPARRGPSTAAGRPDGGQPRLTRGGLRADVDGLARTRLARRSRRGVAGRDGGGCRSVVGVLERLEELAVHEGLRW